MPGTSHTLPNWTVTTNQSNNAFYHSYLLESEIRFRQVKYFA